MPSGGITASEGEVIVGWGRGLVVVGADGNVGKGRPCGSPTAPRRASGLSGRVGELLGVGVHEESTPGAGGEELAAAGIGACPGPADVGSGDVVAAGDD